MLSVQADDVLGLSTAPVAGVRWLRSGRALGVGGPCLAAGEHDGEDGEQLAHDGDERGPSRLCLGTGRPKEGHERRVARIADKVAM